MASVTKTDIRVEVATVETVDRIREVSTINESGSSSSNEITIRVFDRTFTSVLGATTTYSLLSSAETTKNPFFYKGATYLRDTDELFVSSDLLQSTSSSRLPIILISKFSFRRAASTGSAPITELEWMKLRPPPNMAMPSGAIAYKEGVLHCSQGTLEAQSGGLFYMPLGRRPIPLVTNYFGRAFNSIQDVAEDIDGALWFTDSCAGHEQEIRPAPQLPNHVYWFQPSTGELRVAADGLMRPTGIALGAYGHTLYVTDTDAAKTGNIAASTSPATIYAYDVVRQPDGPSFLTNKRIFAFAFSGVPAAIKCDPAGNLFAACADGVEVWDARGTALGVIQIPGGCSSLCFGRSNELFICSGQTLWWVQLH